MAVPDTRILQILAVVGRGTRRRDASVDGNGYRGSGTVVVDPAADATGAELVKVPSKRHLGPDSTKFVESDQLTL